MAYLFPALGEASRDRALKASTVKVYLWLACNLLDCVEERPVKLSGVATALGVDEDTASRAMRLLVDRGYIARQHRGSAGYVYRLYLSRHQ